MIRESAGEVGIMATLSPYPASLSIDYPDRPLNRLTTFFRIFTVIPIGIVLGLLAGGTGSSQSGDVHYQYGAVGIVFLPTVLMLLFRQKYPRWWYDWNLALTKFSYRVSSYLALLRDEDPSTDQEPTVPPVRLGYCLLSPAGRPGRGALVSGVASLTRTLSTGSPAIRRRSILVATRPISRRGWRTVVRAGVISAAKGMSSKPTTLMASGIGTPRSCKAR